MSRDAIPNAIPRLLRGILLIPAGIVASSQTDP